MSIGLGNVLFNQKRTTGGGGVGTLQTVTDAGNTTTNNMLLNGAAAGSVGLKYQSSGVDKWQLLQYYNAGVPYFGLYDADKGYNVMSALTSARVGFFRDDPGYSVDVSGNFRVTSDAFFATTSGGVVVGAAAINAAALLQADSTTKGFLPPRMTTTQRNAIAAPPAGLLVYNATTNSLDVYNGTSWGGAITGSGAATQIPVFSSTNALTGYNYFTVIDGLYPTLAIGVNGTNPVTVRMKTGVASDYCYIDSSSNLTLYGSSTYKGVAFNDQLVGGTQMARFYNSGGTILISFTGRITTTTLDTGGANTGAFNISRTFAEAATGNNQHGFVDLTAYRFGAGAFNAFYAENTVGTTNATYTQDHWAGFQTRITKDGANTIGKLYDFVALAALLNGGTATDRYGFYFYDANAAGGGTLTNQYGIYIPVITGAATKNVGIYSGSVVSIGTDAPNASALLQVDSTSKGFLMPRMTGAQAEAIGGPATGLLIYATAGTGVTITTTGWWGYDGATWVKLN